MNIIGEKLTLSFVYIQELQSKMLNLQEELTELHRCVLNSK